MSQRAYEHIRSAVMAEVWAIQPQKLQGILGFLELKAAGGVPSADVLAQIQANALAASARAATVGQSAGGSVAVLPLYGLIMQRGNMLDDISGPKGTSTEMFTQSFRKAMADPSVRSIVIDIDSPGGTVSGVPELAAEILNARKTKPVVAVSNSLCASAAYWVASACTEIVVSPSALTGSIGVYQAHEDYSAALEQEGVKVTLISYGANKVAGNPYGPPSAGYMDDAQSMVDYYGGMFDAAVAKGRKMKADDVQGKLGGGKVFNAQKAKSSGMADRIGTLDDVLAEYGVSRGPGNVSRAALDVPAVAAANAESGVDDAARIAHAHRVRELELLALR